MTSKPLIPHLLAHRGVSGTSVAPNTLAALETALRSGFGVETDIRDYFGSVCISHDPVEREAPLLTDTLSQLQQISLTKQSTLALNVKSDGLAPFLHEARDVLAAYDYFFFDMSTPQLLDYQKYRLPTAARLSEIEPIRCAGVQKGRSEWIWLDSFFTDWWLRDSAVRSLIQDMPTVIVSPELHGRDPRHAWDAFGDIVRVTDDIYLCTDQPERLLRHLC